MLKIWDSIKYVINIDEKSTQKINYIRDESLYIHDAKQIAQMFNNHFLQIGQKLEKLLDEPTKSMMTT